MFDIEKFIPEEMKEQAKYIPDDMMELLQHLLALYKNNLEERKDMIKLQLFIDDEDNVYINYIGCINVGKIDPGEPIKPIKDELLDRYNRAGQYVGDLIRGSMKVPSDKDISIDLQVMRAIK